MWLCLRFYWKYWPVPIDTRIFARFSEIYYFFPYCLESCVCHNIPYLCVKDILATFCNSSGSYVSRQRISKIIGEITGVTSAAVIHSISPSPQQDILPLHPNQPRVLVYLSPLAELQSQSQHLSKKIPCTSLQSIWFNPLLLIFFKDYLHCTTWFPDPNIINI